MILVWKILKWAVTKHSQWLKNTMPSSIECWIKWQQASTKVEELRINKTVSLSQHLLMYLSTKTYIKKVKILTINSMLRRSRDCLSSQIQLGTQPTLKRISNRLMQNCKDSMSMLKFRQIRMTLQIWLLIYAQSSHKP